MNQEERDTRIGFGGHTSLYAAHDSFSERGIQLSGGMTLLLIELPNVRHVVTDCTVGVD